MPGHQRVLYLRLMFEQVGTLIVGGGQAGLATGYHRAKLGQSFLILDANDRIGDSWRKRWDSLQLFTPAYLNALPGLEFPGPRHKCSTKDEMADYLGAYADRFDLPIRSGVCVDSISKINGRFVISAGDHHFEADNVVLATGGYQAPYVPSFAAQLDPGITQLHSSEYRRSSQLADGDVLVVGAANSGAEIALEVSATHRTWLSGRHPGNEPTRPGSRLDRLVTPPFWFFISRVASVTNPIGRRVRPQMIKTTLPLGRVKPKDIEAAGVVRLPRTIAAQGGWPVMQDGRVVEVPNVVWCTGYRSSFDWVHLDVFDQEGQPIHDRGATAVPGLYFIGLFFLSSLASSLVGGVGRDAEYVARRIAQASRNTARFDRLSAHVTATATQTRNTTRAPLFGRTQAFATSASRKLFDLHLKITTRNDRLEFRNFGNDLFHRYRARTA
jgi:putative flavoprotein involved in K+ transport